MANSFGSFEFFDTQGGARSSQGHRGLRLLKAMLDFCFFQISLYGVDKIVLRVEILIGQSLGLVERRLRGTRLKFGQGESLCQKKGRIQWGCSCWGSKMSNMFVLMAKKEPKATQDQVGICRKRTDIDSLLSSILTVDFQSFWKGQPWCTSESLENTFEMQFQAPHQIYESMTLCSQWALRRFWHKRPLGHIWEIGLKYKHHLSKRYT